MNENLSKIEKVVKATLFYQSIYERKERISDTCVKVAEESFDLTHEEAYDVRTAFILSVLG
jgi:hypothetical protein